MPKPEQRQPLTRARICEAAVRIADSDGLDRLSMRSLAAALGFEVMSLYNHVASKGDLLVGMLDLVASEVKRVDMDGRWQETVRQHSLALKQTFADHPWAVTLWISTMPGPERFDLMEWELGIWAESGLSEEEAHHAFHAVNNHVIGYVLQASMMPIKPDELEAVSVELGEILDDDRHANVIKHIGQHLDGDHGESFEYVLDLIIDGIGTD